MPLPEDPETEKSSFFIETIANALYLFEVGKAYIIIAILVLAGFGIVQLLKKGNESLQKAVTEVNFTPGTCWDPEYVQPLLDQAREIWIQAASTIREGDYQSGLELCHEGENLLIDQRNRFGKQELRPNLTLNQEYQNLFTPVKEALLQQMDVELRKLAQGSDRTLPFSTLRTSIEAMLDLESISAVNARIRTMDQQRAQLATRWIRIRIDSNAPVFTEIVKEHIKAAWDPNLGFSLVFNDPFGPLENQATWKTLVLTCKRTDMEYDWTSKNITDLKTKLIAPPRLPVGLTVSLQSMDRSGYRSNWDKLSLVDIHNSSPDIIETDENTFRALIQIKDQVRKYQEQLAQQLEDQIQLPLFELLPDQPTEAEDALAGNSSLDPETLRRFALYHRDEFLVESLQWLENEDIPNRYQILIVWVELNCDEMCDAFIKYVTLVEERGRELIWDALKKKPWWGNYRPALSMTSPKVWPVCIDVPKTLANHLYDPRIKNKLMGLLADPDYTRGQFLAKAVIPKLTPEDYPLLKQILRQTSPSTGMSIYQPIYLKEPDLAVQWLLELLPSLQPELQRNMIAINSLARNEPHREKLRTLYLQLFNGDASDIVREVILEEFRAYCNDRDNWKAAASLNLDLVSPEQRKAFNTVLLKEAHRMPYEEKSAFWFTIIEQYAEADYQEYLKTHERLPDNKNPYTYDLTKSAINYLFNRHFLEGAELTRLTKLLHSRPEDYNLQYWVMMKWSSDSWDWGSPEVLAIAKLTADHPSSFARIRLLGQIKNLDPDTQRKYAPIIRDRLSKVTERENKRILENLSTALEL